jgi:hypothetical protein
VAQNQPLQALLERRIDRLMAYGRFKETAD